MSEREIVDLGPLDGLEERKATLRKSEDGRRFTCVRVGEEIHVLDDRCPHEGYPLSQGDVRGCELTCAWHNWKFDLETGQCTFGGESVRRYVADVSVGRLLVDVTVDVDAESVRLTSGIRRALAEVSVGAVVRDGLRLGRLVGARPAVGPALDRIVDDACRRAPWGFDHPVATLCDLTAWVDRGWLEGAPALAVAATLVAESRGPAPDRPRPEAERIGRSAITAALREERRDAVEVTARASAETGDAGSVLQAMVPFVAEHLLDYGHGAIYLDKARDLAARFPGAAAEIVAAMAVCLGWSTKETALPPWTATRKTLATVADLSIGRGALGGRREDYEESVLASERSAVDATRSLLADSVAPRELLVAAAHAAARRVIRFDDAWQHRLDAPVSALDVTHTLTFADAALALLPHADEHDAARLAVQAAAFVGKVHRADRASADGASADGASADRAGPPTSATRDLDEAIERRDGAAASSVAAAAADRQGAFRRLAPFAAYDAAVRPIRVAHAVKMTEAARRLDEIDPRDDATYLEALLAFILPRRPEHAHRRTAAVAERFLEDGRPPPGLY